MIAIGIRLLAGRIIATHPANRKSAEWPPHPDRVFMALVAAWGETGRDPAEADALRWLEGLGAPELVASAEACVTRRTVVTSYVPVNDTSLPTWRQGKGLSAGQASEGVGLLPENRSRQARHFPAVTPATEYIWLRWPEAELNAHSQACSRLCSKVTYLGHSSTPIQCWIHLSTQTIPAPTLLPATNGVGVVRLRVPTPGRFENLESRYAAGLRPTGSTWIAYNPPRISGTEASRHTTCFDPRLLVLRQTEGRRFGLSSTLLLTRTLRATLLKLYSDAHGKAAAEWISGHAQGGARSESDHLALLPLAHVGSEHADGHLLGFALAVPRRVPDEEIGRAYGEVLWDKELGEPRELHLTLGSLGVVTLKLDDRSSRPLALQPEVWTGGLDKVPMRCWATVTPICLDRHPKGDDGWNEIEEAIRAAARRVGVGDVLENVTLTAVSTFNGAPANRGFPNLQRKTGGNIQHTHAVLTFREPIIGPLLLGAGRYRGYGFCRPLRHQEDGA